MPVYELNEHEILKEQTKQIREGVEISSGTLYLTDKRLIYELKGKRGFLRASAPVKMIDVYLDAISNVTTAVPRLKLMTKKTLTIEFKTDKGAEQATFDLDDPAQWDKSIREWISDSRRNRLEKEKIEKDEAHKREMELARAKSPRANIGNLYMGGKKKQKVEQKGSEEYIDAEYSESGSTELELARQNFPSKSKSKCSSCGHELDNGMKFCPNCGSQQ